MKKQGDGGFLREFIGALHVKVFDGLSDIFLREDVYDSLRDGHFEIIMPRSLIIQQRNWSFTRGDGST